MEKRTGAAKRTNRSRNNSGGNGKRVFLGVLIIFFVMVVGVGCGFLTATVNTKEDLSDVRPPASSQIYDINGNELANIHAEENRVPVSIRQIPKTLQNAFVAVEDNRFYEHMGVDPKGIMRAIVSNVTSKEVAEGGSTITQQLAKNAFLTQERTMKRKIQEVFLAIRLERQYTKQEILELYLNQIYFGQGAYGVQAAAKTYFGKDVSELDDNECAVLAGIPKSPNYYSPLNNLDAAQKRKSTVLDQMVKYGYMNPSTASALKREPLKLVKQTNEKTDSPKYFINYVIQELINKYGADAVYKDGLKIYTTIDMDMQKAAEEAMKNLPDYSTDESGNKQPQGALVAIDPATGYIKAMVGGRGTDQFNRATMAERQPGSAFKPFVFAAALESDYSPSSMIDDKPLKIGDWAPQNYNRTFNGMVSLRYTAEQSLNVPTVKLAQEVGLEKVIYYAKEMGISTLVLDGTTSDRNDKNFAITLGGLTRGVTPLEITSAYGTFANKGVHVAPVAIVKVLDRNGKVMEEAHPETKQVMKRDSADELTSMLMGVVARGTGTRANIGRPAAGKTGTTSDYHDAWFVGYVPDLVVGVWVGCDDNASLGGMTGGATPAVIWKSFMSKALNGLPVKQFDGVSMPAAVEKPSGPAPAADKKDAKDAKDKKDGKTDDKKPQGADKGAAQSNSEKAAAGGANSPDAPAPAPAPAAPAPAAPEPAAGPSPSPGGAGKQAN